MGQLPRMMLDANGNAMQLLSPSAAAYSLSAKAASSVQALSTGCRVISLYNNGGDGARFRIGDAAAVAVSTDHYIAPGERLWISLGAPGFATHLAIIRAAYAAADIPLEVSEWQ